MALKFRLKGLAETFVDNICCPNCEYLSSEEEDFLTELTKITPEGIVVVAECKFCGEIFVPEQQKIGVINPRLLSNAIENEKRNNTPDKPLPGIHAVKFSTEQLNAIRKDLLH